MKQFGPLQALEFYNDPDAPWVVLLHGFGADAHDLAGLVDAFHFDRPINWLFPNGPLSVPIGPGWTGRAWWPIRMTELPGDWTQLKPEGLDTAADQVLKGLHGMKIDWSKLILGGFSQGAMLATHVFLKAPSTPRGLISLSGTLLNEHEWAQKVSLRANSEVFISHGEMDPVLPSKGSSALYRFFEKNQIKAQMVNFRGGHEIPVAVIQKLQQYIMNRI